MTATPTKVMYLLDAYEDARAGTEGQLLKLVRMLDRSRYEPSLTLFRRSTYIERNGFACPVDVLGITKLASPRSILKILQFGLELRRKHYRLAHCLFNDASLISPAILTLCGIRVVVSRRDMGFWYTPAKLFGLRLVARFVDRYVANSFAVKRVVQAQERVPGRKISVIYNGYVSPLDTNDGGVADALLPGVPEFCPVIGVVANLRPIKRLDTLIEAFSIVAKRFPAARLVIVGEALFAGAARLRGELQVLASRLGIQDRVIFTGGVDAPMHYVRRFTVAVLCSESEGFSNAIIEYMQAARPVVCTDAGGNAELVEDGRNGFLVPVGDRAALADRIVRLLCDTDLARRLGEAGQRSVGALTGERMVVEQMACYDEVLQRLPNTLHDAAYGSRDDSRFSPRP